jgi:Cu2+-containing amine oxidase
MAILREPWREYNGQEAAPHPLDPLTASEIAAVAATVRAHEAFDWPIMPVTTPGFAFEPMGFFERNPSLDVPPSTPHSDHCGGGSST